MYLTKKLLSEADQLLSVSNALKGVANTIAKPKKEIQVVYNGCDFNTFSYMKEDRSQIRNKFHISENDKVLIFVGSITKDKGIFELIAAFKKLNLKNHDLHLFLVGDGPERLALVNIICSNNLDKKVHIIGNQPHKEISKFLKAADIFVLPSYSEGLPNVILEAMASSLPVIASRVGGIPEAMEDGRSGILINKKDVDGLTDAMESLIENEALTKEMGINGKNIVGKKFTWQRNAIRTIEIYQEVAKSEN